MNTSIKTHGFKVINSNKIEGLNNLIMTDSQSPGQSITLVTDGTSAWEII